MYGEKTNAETISRLDYTLENQLQDQFEVLLYKSNSEYQLFIYSLLVAIIMLSRMAHTLLLLVSHYYCCVS